MYQSVTIVGNVGKEPEMRYTPSGQAVTSFSVATNRTYTTKDEQVKETVWFRITTWGKQAEACNQYVKKGMQVLVEGRLEADKATGGPRIFEKKDGTHAATFEITASVVRFLSGNGNGATEVNTPTDDDTPF